MERVLSYSILEIKKKKFMRDLFTSLIAFTAYAVLVYLVSFNLAKTGDLQDIPRNFLMLIPYLILVLSSYSLNQEFSNHTDKVIFTGVFTRSEVLASKLLSLIFTSLISFLFYEVLEVITGSFEVKLIIPHLLTFIIYSFVISSFILMVSTMTSNFIVTGVIGYVLYFDLILALFSNALESTNSELMRKVIPELPFYIANTGFVRGSYSLHQGLVMLMWGLLFFVISCVIINKKAI
ncbi:ABC transporter permease [Clostridium manihotivorum]|uniref:ABC transporter permease n=1 Tax=Clostridium manihotivorum TaxID=2320868 RepID=A0A3R5QYQ5_9CLOT|nr:ABC transporter permease [Clostridium manihotivorum]QAA35339.1 ABC transporter permease [Clostridium manihotivorum]